MFSKIVIFLVCCDSVSSIKNASAEMSSCLPQWRTMSAQESN